MTLVLRTPRTVFLPCLSRIFSPVHRLSSLTPSSLCSPFSIFPSSIHVLHHPMCKGVRTRPTLLQPMGNPPLLQYGGGHTNASHRCCQGHAPTWFHIVRCSPHIRGVAPGAAREDLPMLWWEEPGRGTLCVGEIGASAVI